MPNLTSKPTRPFFQMVKVSFKTFTCVSFSHLLPNWHWEKQNFSNNYMDTGNLQMAAFWFYQHFTVFQCCCCCCWFFFITTVHWRNTQNTPDGILTPRLSTKKCPKPDTATTGSRTCVSSNFTWLTLLQKAMIHWLLIGDGECTASGWRAVDAWCPRLLDEQQT